MAGRRRMMKAAAWCVVLTGVVSIARGATNFVGSAPESPQAAPKCPLCATDEAAAPAAARPTGR
jgi:hypothetical protein